MATLFVLSENHTFDLGFQLNFSLLANTPSPLFTPLRKRQEVGIAA